VVERQLPKLNVAGSIPVSRSNLKFNPPYCRQFCLPNSAVVYEPAARVHFFVHDDSR
jgi:hypothetical protein